MASLVYAPEAFVHIRTAPDSRGKGKVIDVSDDISSGQVSRILNGVSTASLSLLNQNRKYDEMFSPMDAISIRLRRLHAPVLKFTGYLDAVPLWSAKPGSVNLRASCTLKRLQYFMWDPTAPASVDLLNRIDPNASKVEDGGVAQLAINVMTEVANWPKNQIHIARVPHDWFDAVSKISDQLIAESEAASMAYSVGSGSWMKGNNPTFGAMTSTDGIGPGTGTMPSTSGRCSEFGGPNGGAYGSFALTGESGTHPRDPWYIAMRWPYAQFRGTEIVPIPGVDITKAKAWWTNRKILVINPKNNKAVVARAADWGPNVSTGRDIDLSPHIMSVLGAHTDEVLHMGFAPENANLGPISTKDAGLGSALAANPSMPTNAGDAKAISSGWGSPGTNIVAAHAAGLTFYVNRLAKTKFEGFVNDLASQLGYHPQSVSGYSNRNIAGSSTKSNHAWGAAIDIDPSKNPRLSGGAHRPSAYALPKPMAIIKLARKWGLYWGGEYNNSQDYMHFEVIGAPATPNPNSSSYGPNIAGYSGGIVAKWTPPIHNPPGFKITNDFGVKRSYYASGIHTGTDFAAPEGTPIYPVGPGVVHQKDFDASDYGNWVSIDHGNNVYTQYAHMEAPSPVNVGDHVTQKTVIGRVGQTGNAMGPHVHVELRKGADTYAAAAKSGGIDKYVLGGANRSSPPTGVESPAGDSTSASASGGGADIQTIEQGLFNVWQYGRALETTAEGTLLGGYRALLNDTPVLDTVRQFMGAALRDYCSAPNGDFIAWFPDYFGHYGQIGKMIVSPLEVQQDSGPPTIAWDDSGLKTHQFVSGSTVAGAGDSSAIINTASTAGIASVEFPELMMALLKVSRKEAERLGTTFLQREGARPNFTPMDQISGAKAEFFFACYLFQQNWSGQFQASVNLTFMPELFPGMMLCLPEYGIQGYVRETTDSWDMTGGFSTSVTAAPWSSIGNGGPVSLPKGAPL